jgi:hydroxymethylglutaryl-CoA lyase
MQGITPFIPTNLKIDYLNALLKVGFDVLDFGSFVSPKAIPQMRDTSELISKLAISNTRTKLLAIVANTRGANEAVQFDEVSLLGYPFSISPTFLKKNINSTIEASFNTTLEIQNICSKNNKELVVYISMAFGNPYNDPWNKDLLIQWIEKLHHSGIRLISLADTVGLADALIIGNCYKLCQQNFPDIEFGLHLHSRLSGADEKLSAAYDNGCRRFDAVLDGLGGCPMAGKELVGNIDTFSLIDFLQRKNEQLTIDIKALNAAKSLAPNIFNA